MCFIKSLFSAIVLSVHLWACATSDALVAGCSLDTTCRSVENIARSSRWAIVAVADDQWPSYSSLRHELSQASTQAGTPDGCSAQIHLLSVRTCNEGLSELLRFREQPTILVISDGRISEYSGYIKSSGFLRAIARAKRPSVISDYAEAKATSVAVGLPLVVFTCQKAELVKELISVTREFAVLHHISCEVEKLEDGHILARYDRAQTDLCKSGLIVEHVGEPAVFSGLSCAGLQSMPTVAALELIIEFVSENRFPVFGPLTSENLGLYLGHGERGLVWLLSDIIGKGSDKIIRERFGKMFSRMTEGLGRYLNGVYSASHATAAAFEFMFGHGQLSDAVLMPSPRHLNEYFTFTIPDEKFPLLEHAAHTLQGARPSFQAHGSFLPGTDDLYPMSSMDVIGFWQGAEDSAVILICSEYCRFCVDAVNALSHVRRLFEFLRVPVRLVFGVLDSAVNEIPLRGVYLTTVPMILHFGSAGQGVAAHHGPFAEKDIVGFLCGIHNCDAKEILSKMHPAAPLEYPPVSENLFGDKADLLDRAIQARVGLGYSKCVARTPVDIGTGDGWKNYLMFFPLYKDLCYRSDPIYGGRAVFLESSCSRALTTKLYEHMMSGLFVDSALPPKELSALGKTRNVYVSLTTSPTRIHSLRNVLDSVDMSVVQKVFLNLPRVFKRDGSSYEIPDWVSTYPKLEILWTEEDYGPITKILPSLQHLKRTDSTSLLITFDDDVQYPRQIVNELVRLSLADPKTVVGTVSFALPGTVKVLHGSRYLGDNPERFNHPDMYDANQLLGFAGSAYPVEVLEPEQLLAFTKASRSCFLHDDAVLNYALELSGVRKLVARTPRHSSLVVLPLQYGMREDGLRTGAGTESHGSSIDSGYERFFKCLGSLYDYDLPLVSDAMNERMIYADIETML